MGKELWIAAFDELVDEYLQEHEDATEEEAIKAVEAMDDRVSARAGDKMGDMIDHMRMLKKDGLI